MSVAIPVHMKRGFLGPVPFVVIVDTSRTALIHVGRKRYENIMAPLRQATYLDKLSGTQHAFAEYADRLAGDPLEEVISRHPGSIVVDNDEVLSFALSAGHDGSTGRPQDHYGFAIKCRRRRYTGSVDRGTDVSGKTPALREVFGERFRLG
ncbi:MAG TPA: hypothetical protein GX716_10065 [Firmicutes bacterium]|nr:hypothetical protein [Candidatus Fermentithermobacillaceae bacterium]